MTILTDLPEDILAITFSFLDAKSFLGLCQTCKDLYQYRQDPAYWRRITAATFRLPISPLLRADGARWYWLYKRLRTQAKLFTWGEGIKGNLGPGRQLLGGFRGRRIRVPRTVPTFQRTDSSWPTEVAVPAEVGVIADLQCGGWSTSILSSEGKIYTVGSINPTDFINMGEAVDHFKNLEYLTQSTSAIRQFSSGRAHVLALTDDREMLSWDRINAKGLKILPRSGQDFGGKAVRVVAGWGESSAYVPETGIIFWKPINNGDQDDLLDGRRVKEVTIPGTARRTLDDNSIWEVTAHVVLEAWIVWATSDSKLFACSIDNQNDEQLEPTNYPFEVPGYSSSERVLRDVQGQFTKFAVFTDAGEVLAGATNYLRACAEQAKANPSNDNHSIPAPLEEWSGLDRLVALKPADNPALQHDRVISVAFGDHHHHALHVDGTITSYGTNPKSIGALGLGDLVTGSRFRGVKSSPGIASDSKLLPLAERRGRQVWFEPEKRDWLMHMEYMLRDGKLQAESMDQDGNPRPAMGLWSDDVNKQFMFSEWVEQEGRHWSDGPAHAQDLSAAVAELKVDAHDFHLDPFFAIAVTAAGWHSGALVVHDEERADMIKQKWTTVVRESEEGHGDQDDDKPPSMPGHFETGPSDPEETYVWKLEGFPKVELPDGFEMPGHGSVRRWRDGRPTLQELGLDWLSG